MIWDEKFPIGNGERVDEDDSVAVYRSYPECGIEISTKEQFDNIAAKYNMFIQTELLKNLVFTPKVAPKQALSNYYFLKLDFKIPRPKNRNND